MNKKNRIIRRGRGLFLFFPGLFMLLSTGTGFTQENEISGKVISLSKSIPLSEVIVSVEGENTKTETAEDGTFSLSLRKSEAILNFKLEGYNEYRYYWEGQGNIEIFLVSGQEVEKGHFILSNLQPGMVGVKESDLDAIPFESAGEALKGRVTGVNVISTTGQPGDDPLIQIRGISTFLFNHDPVILVDGIPVLSLSDINFNDVESVEVLKDAFSTSMFGRKGANGIVIVTTKRGKSVKNMVSFNVSYGIQSLSKRYELLNGTQSFDFMEELNQPFLGTPGDKSAYWGNEFESGIMIDRNNLYNIDWQDELFRSAPQQNYSLVFTGGSEQTRFRVSGSYFDRTGILKPSGYTRFSFSFNLDHKISDRLEIGSNVYFTKSGQKVVNIGSSAENGGVVLSALASAPFLPSDDGVNSYFINPMRPEINNVHANINGIEDKYDRSIIIPGFFLNYKIIDGLKLQLAGASNINLTRRSMFMSTKHTYLGRYQKGMGIYSGREFISWDFDVLLSYDKSFGEHNIGILGGYRLYGNRFSWNETIGKEFPTDDVKMLNAASSKVASSNINNYRDNAFIGQLSYNFNNRYMIAANIRAESSTRFSNDYHVESDPIKPEDWEIVKDAAWGASYGVALQWKISEEDFMANVKRISDLGIIFTYGKTGNDGGYNTGRIYPVYWTDTVPELNPDEDLTEVLFPGIGFPQRNLQNQLWESMTEFNIGFDLGIMNNRLHFSAGYFKRNISDLILPDFSDTIFLYSNLGEHSTGGLELLVNTVNISGERIEWHTGLYGTYLMNEVKGLGDRYENKVVGFGSGSNIIMPGQPVYEFWGYQTDGIFQNQTEVDGHAFQPGAGPGDIRYVDRNADNVINDEDRTILGNPSPDFMVGFDNVIRFGDIELTIFLQGVFGNEILNLTRMQTEGFNDFINQSSGALNRWTGEGTSQVLPRATIGENNILISDRFIEDGSYLRLKNIVLAYYIPQNVIGKVGMEQAKIYLTGQNLLTFTSYKGYNPEVSTFGPLGVDYGGYPQCRYIGGGIQVSF